MATNDTNPYLLRSFAPIYEEVTARSLAVEGKLPDGLEGVFVRNGPNPKFPPRGRYHWFDGDGMLHAVRFADGQAEYRNRWVSTEHLAEEEAVGTALWGGLVEPVTENPPHAPYKNTANTDVVAFAGELLATSYLGGKAYRVDPSSLDTLGPLDPRKDGRLRMAAHGKVDPESGELMFFDFAPTLPVMTYGVLAKDGSLANQIKVTLPGPRLPHDIAITKRHTVLLDLPVFFGADAVRQRRWKPEFHPEIPARFGVLPRHGSASEIRWFDASPCYIYHVVNAWETSNEIVLVGMRVADPVPKPDPQHGVWASMLADTKPTARLHRWRFDLQSGAVNEEALVQGNFEFPAINPAVVGRPSRYAYMARLSPEETVLFDAVVKVDLETGVTVTHEYGPGRYGSEVAFVSAPGAKDEDDGWLLSFVYDTRNLTSEVVVLSARALADGPLARVILPQRVPLGFHACFVPGRPWHAEDL